MSRGKDDEHGRDGFDDELTGSARESNAGESAQRLELIPRPAPEGMSRKDRKLWRVLEAERIAAAVNRTRPSDGYRAIRPGRVPRRSRLGLGRRGRKAFRDADWEYREQSWAKQKDRADMDTKARGVLVFTLVLLGLVVWRLIPSSNDDPAPVGNGSPTVAASSAATAPRTAASASAAPSSEVESSSAPSATTSSSSVVAASSAAASLSSAAETAPTESAVFGNGTDTVPPTSAPGSGTAVVTAAGVVAVTTASSTPSVPAAPKGAVPAASRRSAVSTGTAWFERTCGSSWQQPFGAAVTANRAVMTDRGWAYANPAKDAAGRRWWDSVVQRHETRQCRDVSVKAFAGPGPKGPTVATLIFQADRVVTSDFADVAVQVEKFTELRTLTRGTDGLWRVGPPELAG